jgi:hypothetical protein
MSTDPSLLAAHKALVKAAATTFVADLDAVRGGSYLALVAAIAAAIGAGLSRSDIPCADLRLDGIFTREHGEHRIDDAHARLRSGGWL